MTKKSDEEVGFPELHTAQQAHHWLECLEAAATVVASFMTGDDHDFDMGDAKTMTIDLADDFYGELMERIGAGAE